MRDKKINIHLYCFKDSMCNLIRKFLGQDDYKITCMISLHNEDFSSGKSDDADCIILDNNLDKEFKDSIKRKFSNIPIICLPSLNAEVCVDNGAKYIHEPLRLSELGKVLNEMFS